MRAQPQSGLAALPSAHSGEPLAVDGYGRRQGAGRDKHLEGTSSEAQSRGLNPDGVTQRRVRSTENTEGVGETIYGVSPTPSVSHDAGDVLHDSVAQVDLAGPVTRSKTTSAS
jgi:hypothetical protein